MRKEELEQLQRLAGEHKAAQERRRAADRTKNAGALIRGERQQGFGGNDRHVRFRLGGAAGILRHGLLWALGDEARWLPEYDEVAAWLADNRGKGLLCMGDCGRGKTVIARDILPHIFTDSIHLMYNYTTAKRLKDDYAAFSRYKVLCIDDIGTEAKMRSYGNVTDYIEDIVDLCEEQQKLLVCTTNLTTLQLVGGTDDDPDSPTFGKVFQGRYDLRTFDRLKSLCTRVVFEGPSMRDEDNREAYPRIADN